MDNKRFWVWALSLSVITILYNLLEGLFSVYFGLEDGILSLLGFGIDSFIEVLSGIGIFHMVIRILKNRERNFNFERTALKITGISFYILSLGLLFSAFINTIEGNKPDTTFWGVVISLISILTMSILVKAKLYVGKKLVSEAIIADAYCTKTCLYLSFILLVASFIFEVFKIGYIDSIGALGISYLSFKEGKESFERAEEGCSTCYKGRKKY